MNLPAAIEDTSGTAIPQSLLDKALRVRESGGIKTLEVSMRELPDLLQRNKELLDEVRILFSEIILKPLLKSIASYLSLALKV